MLCFGTIPFLVLMCGILTSNAEEKNLLIDCSVQRKCSTAEDTVWAVHNERCYLFRNPCIFANEMCLRRDKNQEEHKVVTREECKIYCRNLCGYDYPPVCGEYDNEHRKFGNMCEFYKHSCQNDQPFIFLQDGECDQAVVA